MNGGRILVALLLATGVLGVLVNGSLVYSRLIYLSVLLVVVSWLWTTLSLHKLRITRQARSLRANVGDIFEEHFEISNSGRLACLWMEIINESPIPQASGSRLLTSIGGRQKRTYVVKSWLTRRGRYPLGPTVLTSGDPFGLFSIKHRYPATESLIVLPLLVDITSFPSPAGLLPGGKVIQRKSMDITPHAAGVREYLPGDPMKRIHWPTTVRRQQLMVKDFEQDPQTEIWIFFDAQVSVHANQEYESQVVESENWLFGKKPKFTLPPSTLEYAISITASLVHYFIQHKQVVGFIAAGQVQTVIQAERSLRQETKILETLAFIDARGELPIENLVAVQAKQLPQGSCAIIITPSVQLEVLLAVDDLQRHNMRPIVVLLMADSFGGYTGSNALLESMVARNIPVCPIYCGMDLAQALNNFSEGTPYKDLKEWYRPQFIHWI